MSGTFGHDAGHANKGTNSPAMQQRTADGYVSLFADFDFIVIEKNVMFPSFNAVTGVEPDCVRASFCS